MPFYNKHFSHIYVEEEAYNYPLCFDILNCFSKSVIIKVDSYKDIVSRTKQAFSLQKKSKCLVIAVKKSGFLYDYSRFAQDIGQKNLFYNALTINCLYDCSYCYLQGMSSSANLVSFINLQDFFSETEEAILNRKYTNYPFVLCLSLDTDILSFENIVPYCRKWINFAYRHKDFIAEIRTKSTNFHSISGLEPTDRVLLAWTLSPNEVASRYEQGAPSPKQRVLAAKEAVDRGWRIRLCFDPVIPIDGWRELYTECVNEAFGALPIDGIQDATVGTFRMAADHLRVARKNRPEVELLHQNWEVRDGVVALPRDEQAEVTTFIKGLILKWLPDNHIYVW
ncbi:MAG: hypothetical protein CMI32_07360 [Opitutales bacterium]|nr:hypothetical protein [Opitutales bacterium]